MNTHEKKVLKLGENIPTKQVVVKIESKGIAEKDCVFVDPSDNTRVQ